MTQGYYTGSMAVAAADDVLIALAMAHLLGVRRNGVRRFVVLMISSGEHNFHIQGNVVVTAQTHLLTDSSRSLS